MSAMLRKTLAWVAAAACVAGPLSADWVTLKDGRRVRGIDYRQCPKGHLFTVEDGRVAFIKAGEAVSHEKSPPGEKVEFRGEQVTLRSKINALRKEREEHQKELRAAIAAWARGGKNAEERRAFVMAQSAAEQELLFGRTLAESRLTAARRLAVCELERFRTDHATGALAVAMIVDKDADVRAQAFEALRKNGDPKTGEHCIRYLLSADKDQRLRSSRALQTFPTIRAVPSLLLTIHKVWTGGQRSYFYQGAIRAYIGDYELVSGGTTYMLTEVADPIVRFSETGVVLDAKIALSEETIHLRTLETITGRRFGKDVEKWREWWNAEGEARLAQALAAPQAGPRDGTPAGATQ